MADFSKIRILCKHNAITLKQLAKEIEMSDNGIQNILLKNNCGIDKLEKLCKYFGVPPNYFLEGLESEFESVKTLKKRIEELEKDKEFLKTLLENLKKM